MRHRNVGRRFSRPSGHLRALFRNLMASLIQHEMIKTTVPKAKELRRYLEPLITLAKEDSVAHRRLAFNRLRNEAAVTKLFTVIAKQSQKRPGGYLRIIRCGFRQGDSAPMSFVEWVDRTPPKA